MKFSMLENALAGVLATGIACAMMYRGNAAVHAVAYAVASPTALPQDMPAQYRGTFTAPAGVQVCTFTYWTLLNATTMNIVASQCTTDLVFRDGFGA